MKEGDTGEPTRESTVRMCGEYGCGCRVRKSCGCGYVCINLLPVQRRHGLAKLLKHVRVLVRLCPEAPIGGWVLRVGKVPRRGPGRIGEVVAVG